MFKFVNTNTKKKRFRKSNISFFDFTCFESHDKNDYVIVNDKMHYRNVWFFLDSTNVIITIKDFSLIRINFHRCFRNDAQTWYIIELINEQRADLIRNRDINRWKKKLTKRFRMNEIDVLILLIENKYIVENVRNQRSIFFYVQNVVRHCKNAHFLTIFSQLFWAWNHFDSNFQRDVEKSDFFIIVLRFIQKMKKKQIVWKRYYVKKISSKKQWQFSSFSQYDQQYNQQSINQNYNRNQQYDNNNRNDNNRDYNDRNNNQQYNQQNDQNRYDQSLYFINFRSINQQQQRFIEIFFSKQTSWQKVFWNIFAFATFSFSTSTYYTNAIDEKYFEKTYHAKKKNQHENEKKSQFRSANANVYFNDHN